MSKVQASPDLSTIDEKDIRKYVTLVLVDIVDKVNGKLDLGVNVSGKIVSVPFTAANTDTTISHGLGKTPTGYLVVGLSTNMIVYDGTVAKNSSTITLKSSAIGTAQIYFF